jgi:hypothetical protein
MPEVEKISVGTFGLKMERPSRPPLLRRAQIQREAAPTVLNGLEFKPLEVSAIRTHAR